MKQNKLTFGSENLVVEYITFKFQDLEDSTKTKKANHLFKIGFNFYKESGKLAKPIKEPILLILKINLKFLLFRYLSSLFLKQK
jgi:hypothetical protein